MNEQAKPSRKALQRERDKAGGFKRVELRLPPSLAQKLDELCRIRGGVTGAYEVQELIETLIAQDFDKLQLQLEQLLPVKCKCGKALPEGCGGVHKGESDCFATRDYRQLMLNEPARITIQELDAILAPEDY